MYTRQDYLDHKCTHREYYAQFVNDLQKRMIFEVWSAKELARAWEDNEAFNTHETKVERWDRIACPIDHRIMDEAGEHSAKAMRVCVLKEAAKQIVENFYEQFGRRYSKFRYRITYVKTNSNDTTRYHVNVIGKDEEAVRRSFVKPGSNDMLLHAEKIEKYDAVEGKWVPVHKD